MTDLPVANVQTAMMQAQGHRMTAARARLDNEMSEIKNMEKIEAAAQEYEAMFLSEMLRPMFDGIKPDPMFGGGKGEEVFQNLLLDEYGKAMANAGGIGLAQHVKAELIRIQQETQQ